MRKIFVLCFFALSFTAISQKREKGTIEIVPLIGYSNFHYFNHNGDSSDYLPSANFGVDGDYYFSDHWSLRSGILFHTMGAEFNPPSPMPGNEKLNYLSIPLNANWHFGSTRKWNLNFGLTPSFLLSAKGNYVGIGEMDIKDLTNPFQLGFSFGIGYKIAVSDQFSFLIDYQGFTGLTYANKKMQDFKDLTNNGSSFNLGGVFHFK